MSVAKSYARALFDVAAIAKNPGVFQEIKANLIEAFQTIQSNKSLHVALRSPITSSREKQAVVTKFSEAAGHSEIVKKFLNLLARKNRLTELEEICSQLEAIRVDSEGGVLGQIESADALSESDVQDLSRSFKAKLKKNVEFEVSIQPDLLAGVRVTVGGVTYDGTLRSQLDQAKRQFSKII